jgi:hypothetical protein
MSLAAGSKLLPPSPLQEPPTAEMSGRSMPFASAPILLQSHYAISMLGCNASRHSLVNFH